MGGTGKEIPEERKEGREFLFIEGRDECRGILYPLEKGTHDQRILEETFDDPEIGARGDAKMEAKLFDGVKTPGDAAIDEGDQETEAEGGERDDHSWQQGMGGAAGRTPAVKDPDDMVFYDAIGITDKMPGIGAVMAAHGGRRLAALGWAVGRVGPNGSGDVQIQKIFINVFEFMRKLADR